jgi:hypothetical protein
MKYVVVYRRPRKVYMPILNLGQLSVRDPDHVVLLTVQAVATPIKQYN